MRRALPISLLLFIATGGVFLLQTSPTIGIFLMFMMAMFWSVLLINAGMIGIAIEALTGRVFKAWLLVPIAFYGLYFSFAAYDHFTLTSLGKEYDAANLAVRVPFDHQSQALVFENGRVLGGLTQNFALDVEFSVNEEDKFRSARMMEREFCQTIHEDRSLLAAGIYTSGFHDGDGIGSRVLEERFCIVTMPETPDKPQVRVRSEESSFEESLLPVRGTTTKITTPDGRSFELKGGTASPLRWIPMPAMGCALNSGGPSWDCGWGFLRSTSTPIVSGTMRYGRDSLVLARALGLKPVAVSERRTAEMPEAIRVRLQERESETLQNQFANVEAMIANPLIDNPDWDTGVLVNNPEALSTRADAIMTGVEKAAQVGGADRFKARESGRILAGLVAALPEKSFQALKPRILGVYRRAGEDHWLWTTESLIRRLGDFGIEAMPYLINSLASGSNLNDAGIEGVCRVGLEARDLAMPTLMKMWNSSRDGYDIQRAALFVAMRRMGNTPPPLAEDKHNQYSSLQRTWADISPRSPASVCSTSKLANERRLQEVMARRTRRGRSK